MKNNKLYIFSFLLWLLPAVSQPTWSAEQQWVVGVEDTSYYPHYEIREGQWAGFGAALLNAFGASAGYEFIYKPMPVERLFRSFTLGEVDFKYPAAPAWKSELKSGLPVTYSQPVIDYLDGITLLQHRAGRGIDSIRSIGTVRGFSPIAWTDRIEDGTITLVQSDSFLSLVKLVLRGRVDAIYANVDVVAHLFSQQAEIVSENTPLVFDQSLPHDRGSYRLATLDQESVILEFNAWMEINSELIEQLKAEYFGSSRP